MVSLARSPRSGHVRTYMHNEMLCSKGCPSGWYLLQSLVTIIELIHDLSRHIWWVGSTLSCWNYHNQLHSSEVARPSHNCYSELHGEEQCFLDLYKYSSTVIFTGVYFWPQIFWADIQQFFHFTSVVLPRHLEEGVIIITFLLPPSLPCRFMTFLQFR